MKNKKIITAFLAITFSLLSILTPLACVAAKMDQATTYQESNRKENRRMSAQGTAVPNTGYVENVYFNTSLSVEEVVSIIEDASLNFVAMTSSTNITEYILLVNSEFSSGFVLEKDVMSTGTFYTIFVGNLAQSTKIFDSYPNQDDGIIGWKSTTSSYSFNATAVNNFQGVSVGAQNEALSSLFSITPFEENPTLIETIGTGIANSAELFGDVLENALTAIASVFFANNELTLLDTVLVIAIGATVVSFAIKLLLKLIQKIKV